MYVGGLLGCCGDAYTGSGALGLEESRDFHKWEIELLQKQVLTFYMQR